MGEGRGEDQGVVVGWGFSIDRSVVGVRARPLLEKEQKVVTDGNYLGLARRFIGIESKAGFSQ